MEGILKDMTVSPLELCVIYQREEVQTPHWADEIAVCHFDSFFFRVNTAVTTVSVSSL